MKKFLTIAAAVILSGCYADGECDVTSQRLDYVETQTDLLLTEALQRGQIPRTINTAGSTHWVKIVGFDWTEGFFPGTLWYLYEATGEERFRKGAIAMQELIADDVKASSHDLGFVFNCSFGNGYRLTKDESMLKAMIASAETLIGRFKPETGVIQSWNVNGKGWMSQRGWMYPVIIDNMMNLELLFEVSNYTGDTKYRDIAITHANTTMRNHFRDDYSSYHVVDYDANTGEVRSRQTAQGYANSSSWARGQAWALYGYVTCYRYTKDENYLELAKQIANYIMSAPEIPADRVPYWDYHAPNIPAEPRDVSSAVITASALLELNDYCDGGGHIDYVKEIMNSVSSDSYRAKIGENNNFVLMHSVGSIPKNNEIDVPLNYADYYYLEALIRMKNRGL